MQSPANYSSAYSLVRHLFAQETGARRAFLTATLLTFCIGVLGSYLYAKMLEGAQGELLQQLILLYMGQKFVDTSMEACLHSLQQRSVRLVCQRFERDCLDWYVRFTSFESREKIDAPKFYHALIDVKDSVIKSISFWLVFQIMGVLTTSATALFSFGAANAWLLAVLIVALALVIRLVYLPKRRRLLQMAEDRQKSKEIVRGKLSFVLPQFTWHNVTADEVVELTDMIDSARNEFNLSIMKLQRIITFTIIACNSILFFIDEKDMIPTLVSLTMFATAVNNLLECMTHLSYAENKFNEFRELVGKMELQEDIGTIGLPLAWSITSVNIPRTHSTIEFSPQDLPLTIQHGSTILVRGSSGHGKSTLVKGITGQLGGVEIDYLDARVFRDSFVLVGQGGKHKLEFESLTLAELFETQDEALIESLCYVCLLDFWLADMRESAGARSVLDQEIVLSGGERNRLTLAYYLWVAERRRAQVLVLDECEQGTDVANVGDGGDVYELLLRIRRAYQDMTLIVVSHFYDADGNPLVQHATTTGIWRPIDWSAVITMQNFRAELN